MNKRVALLLSALVLVAAAAFVVSRHTQGDTRDTFPFSSEPPPSTMVGASVGADEPVDVGLELWVRFEAQVTDLQAFPDGSGRFVVLEKTGRARLIEDGTLLDTPYLDVRDLGLTHNSERGLLGLAFAPDFATSGRFYVNFTAEEGATQIARVTADPSANRVDTSALEVILTIEQPYSNHNGGQLRFGPDGMLWIGTGDGGAGGDPQDRAEDPTSLLGKMLRIDVSTDTGYAIPAGNAYPNGERGRAEIWGIGLRNPWRFAFDPNGDDLWVADVGQGHWEEIHRVPLAAVGTHFGWNTLEGSHCFPHGSECDPEGLTLPVYEYSHRDGCSISGGVVYRGDALPALRGSYLFADFCHTWVRALRQDGDAFVADTLFDETGLRIVAFGEDEAGEVYILGLEGNVYRLAPAAEPTE